MRITSNVLAAAVLLGATLVPARAFACSCRPGIVPFKDAARGAPLLVAARVVDFVRFERADARAKGEIAAVDVEVIRVFRGREDGKRVRVWDHGVGAIRSIRWHEALQLFLPIDNDVNLLGSPVGNVRQRRHDETLTVGRDVVRWRVT